MVVVGPRVLRRCGCPIAAATQKTRQAHPLKKPLGCPPYEYHLLQVWGARGGEGSSMSSAELFSAVSRLQVRAMVRGGGGDRPGVRVRVRCFL